VVAIRQKRAQARRGLRNRVRRGNARDVEALALEIGDDCRPGGGRI
jgi:hypothetical protein